MAPIIVVLGMHRSGTSCLANALGRAGVYLGPDLMGGASHDNLEGHGESWEAVRINDHLLERSGGSWCAAPPELELDPATAARMAAFVEGLRAHPVAGWKDPRTTLTFAAWRPHLPEYRLLACLRHPLNVAHSLRVREGWPLERGLDLWAAYNERLLAHAEAAPEAVSWFDFDAPEADLSRNLRGLLESLGLEAAGPAAEGFNPFLRHHTGRRPIPDDRAAALYERLRLLAGATPAPSPAASGASLENRLAQLARAQQLQDGVLQQAVLRQENLAREGWALLAGLGAQFAAFAESQQQRADLEAVRQRSELDAERLRAECKGLRAVADDLREANACLSERLREAVGQLDAVRASRSWRLVRWLRRTARAPRRAASILRRLAGA